MSGLIMHRLVFTLKAHDPVAFGIQAGAQLRGALYEVLQRQSCSAPNGKHDAVQAEFCPVCWLMARENSEAARGKDVPRAFTIQPPDNLRFPAGSTFQFGLSLFGKAISLFPYLVLALPLMGETGVGYGRGRFTLESIDAIEPLSEAHERLYTKGDAIVRQQPHICTDQAAVEQYAQGFSGNNIKLNFLTPMRLIRHGQLCKTPVFAVLMARLLERVDLLQHEYGEPSTVSPYEELIQTAEQIGNIEDATRWVEIQSGSRRLNTTTPISGFVGTACFQGDFTSLWTWLLWGSCVQVGKDTVKGNGLFRLERLDTT